jgi:hypothetical protein
VPYGGKEPHQSILGAGGQSYAGLAEAASSAGAGGVWGCGVIE